MYSSQLSAVSTQRSAVSNQLAAFSGQLSVVFVQSVPIIVFWLTADR
jgi:hypothetical protein